MHSLDNDPVRQAGYCQHAFVTHEIRTVDARDSTQKILKPPIVKVAIAAKHERADLVLVVMVMPVSQESWSDLQHRVEIEAADIEEITQRGLPEMHGRNVGTRIDLMQPLRQYLDLLASGLEPVILDAAEMERVAAKFAGYGKVG